MSGNQIIANHSVVEKYKDIPYKYIENVKKMWINIPGESHSLGYGIGCRLLQMIDGRFEVKLIESGTPEGPTNQYLRINRATWGDKTNTAGWIYGYGEEDFFTNDTAVQRTKAHLAHCEAQGLHINVFGFGWCWDMTWINKPGGTMDPVYETHWAGSSVGGPEGNLRWGLDKNDQTLTGNSVCMDTYLNAVVEYMKFCKENGYNCKAIFTTGPVDTYKGESGYQREIKHKYIRDFVSQSLDRILFDYADILCWSDSGQENLISWHGQQYTQIHPDNMKDLDLPWQARQAFYSKPHSIPFRRYLAHPMEIPWKSAFRVLSNSPYIEDGDHIGTRGALRLGKAIWWMLARISGWDGVSAD